METLVDFKMNRNSMKDKEDLTIIQDYLDNNHLLKRNIILMHQTSRRKMRNAIYSFLRKLPLRGRREDKRFVSHVEREKVEWAKKAPSEQARHRNIDYYFLEVA